MLALKINIQMNNQVVSQIESQRSNSNLNPPLTKKGMVEWNETYWGYEVVSTL